MLTPMLLCLNTTGAERKEDASMKATLDLMSLLAASPTAHPVLFENELAADSCPELHVARLLSVPSCELHAKRTLPHFWSK